MEKRISEEVLLNVFKDEDDAKIEKIITGIKKYDKKMFLQRVSALRLCFENRNLAVLIDAIITETLRWLSTNEWDHTGITMSYGKFKKIINSVNQLESKSAVDSFDNPYMDDIQFYGNYRVLPGINESSSYNLNILIHTIFKNGKSRLSEENHQTFIDTISFHLSVSTSICSQLNIDNNLEFRNEIFIPNKQELDTYMELISYDHSHNYFHDFLISKSELKMNDNQPFSQIQHAFLVKPYLELDNDILLLDATSIANSLCHYLSREVLFQDVFNVIWNDIKDSLIRLGHFKVKANKLSLSLIDEKNYKESIFSVSNDKILLVFGVFKGINENDDISRKISERLKSITDNVIEYGIEKQHIFVLICMQTFGGNIAHDVIDSSFPHSIIKASELRVVSEIEKDSFFLPRFMRAKQNRIFPNVFGDFWALIYFSKNDMSFYAGDDIDYREMQTVISMEETTDYYLEALKRNRSKIFKSLEDDNWYTGVSEDFDQRYLVGKSISQKLKYFIEAGNHKIIEVTTEEIKNKTQFDVLLICSDTVSYWLEKYYSYKDIEISTLIQLKLENTDIQNYFVEHKSFKKSEKPSIYIDKNRCVVEISASYYREMGMSRSNYSEKELITRIINAISGSVDNKVIDELFNPDFKKKMTSVVVDDNGKLKIPTRGFKLLKISHYETNKLLDELGEYLKEQGIKHGGIPKELNVKVCNDIVSFLYSLLEKEVRNFDKNQLLHILVAQIETLLPLQLRDESSYNNDINLSPTEKGYFFDKLNENNRCALATKFLLEYVIATPIPGTNNVGMWEFERILAICTLLIEWAHRSDYFEYKLVDTTICFLPSNRIGLNKNDFNKVNNAMLSSRNDQLKITKEIQINSISRAKKIDALIMEKINASFREAFGFTYEVYDSVINLLVDTFNDLDKFLWIEDKKSIIDKIYFNANLKMSRESIISVLNFITLKEREAYLKPPKGYKVIDIYPWVFNRPLSFIRRPIIEYEDKYIFGIRNVIYSRKYLLHLIWQGKLKTSGKLMKDLMSRLRNIEGEAFNEKIRCILDLYEEIEVIKGVSKIGNKYITDENNNTLGDIDILVINRKKKKICLVETKDFSFSRNPYEIAMEHKKLFSDDKSFVMKHLRRHMWVVENIKYVLEHYKLEQGDWKIVPMFIVSEYLVTKDLIKKTKVQIYEESQISENIFY